MQNNLCLLLVTALLRCFACCCISLITASDQVNTEDCTRHSTTDAGSLSQLLIQHQLTKIQSGNAFRIRIRRTHVYEDGHRYYVRSNCPLHHEPSIIFLYATDQPEQDVDGGGPRREYFRMLLYGAISTLSLKGSLGTCCLSAVFSCCAAATSRPVGK